MRNYLYSISTLFPLRLLTKLTRQKLLLPSYHLVSDEDVPHIKHLYSIRNSGTFKKDIEFLLKYYHPLSLSDLQNISKGNKILTKPSFYLTFDDGLKQISDTVVPILKEYGLTATFFLNSAFVDNKGLMFRYKASLIIDNILTKSYPKEFIEHANEIIKAKDLSTEGLVSFIKSIKHKETYLLDQLAETLQINFKDFLNTYKPYLNHDEIQKLITDGFTVGAHSIDHPEYRHISNEEQIRQTNESMNYIVQNFNPEIKTFAFPFNDTSVSKSFFDYINSNKIIDLSFGGAGLKKDTFNTHLQRVPMERTKYSAKQILKAEYLYYLLKAPLGKNYIQRK